MRNRYELSLAHPKRSQEPQRTPDPEPSCDPLHAAVAVILEDAAEAQEKAADDLRLLARKLRG